MITIRLNNSTQKEKQKARQKEEAKESFWNTTPWSGSLSFGCLIHVLDSVSRSTLATLRLSDKGWRNKNKIQTKTVQNRERLEEREGEKAKKRQKARKKGNSGTSIN